MPKPHFLSLLLACLMGLLACSSKSASNSTEASNPKDLTRAKASSLIDARPEFQKVEILSLEGPQFDAMVRDKLWFQPKYGDWWQPTEETKKYFTAVTMNTLKLAHPIKRVVHGVDGITDEDPNTKEVSFTYQYADVPDFVSKHGGLPPAKTYPAHAEMRLYDDGWRVEQIQYQ